MHLQTLAKILFLSKSLLTEEGARMWCAEVKKVVENGDFTRGQAALEMFEKQLGDDATAPHWQELEEALRGELLLRAGVLTSWVGSADQREGELERAKDMLSEAMGIFAQSGRTSRAAEAQIELGFLYWRGGEDAEARDMLTDALAKLTDEDDKLKAVALLRIAAGELTGNRFYDALTLLQSARRLFEEIDSAAIQGRFHNTLGVAYKELGLSEERKDYFVLARIEYEAARLRFLQAGNVRFVGYVENNLGFLGGVLGDFATATKHLNRARITFKEIKDFGCLAQVDETRAQILLKQGKHREAEWRALSAIRTLAHGDEMLLLSEALVTHGRACARLGQVPQALRSFQRAYEAATRVGNNVQAGNSSLALIEELSDHLKRSEMLAAYNQAASHLKETSHLPTLRKLKQCAGQVITRLERERSSTDEEDVTLLEIKPNFSLKEAVQEYEGKVIKRAWALTGGKLNQTSKLLGLSGHQVLSDILRHRQKNLLGETFQPQHRRRSIIKHPPRRTRATKTTPKTDSAG